MGDFMAFDLTHSSTRREGPGLVFRAAGMSPTIGCQMWTRLRVLRATGSGAARVRRLVLFQLG
jgi:hypothetical protein